MSIYTISIIGALCSFFIQLLWLIFPKYRGVLLGITTHIAVVGWLLTLSL